MPRRLLLIALAAAAAVAAFLLRPVPADVDAGSRLAYDDPEVVARGEVIYDAQCAACHGADLEGQPDWRVRDADGLLPAPPHDENGHTWHHPSEMLIAITRLGSEELVGGGYRSAMQGFGDVLSDEEIAATLAYIKSTWPAEIIAAHDEIDARHTER
ncbi:cytochrome c [uncultured Jannaschia sp.]|uniref:c-type cytochrome n=1 Tax=uncultured Jannaschia sp. TaxID=293347 RepID=UPI00260253B8|nr:cytochrome c [uncultured Jannaschia sp.]